MNNKLLNTEEENAEGLIRDHFVWKEDGRKVEEEKEEAEEEEVDRETVKEIVKKVENILSRRQNSSASRPDSISYRFIKTIKNTTLGEKLLESGQKSNFRDYLKGMAKQQSGHDSKAWERP